MYNTIEIDMVILSIYNINCRTTNYKVSIQLFSIYFDLVLIDGHEQYTMNSSEFTIHVHEQ